MCNFSVEFTAAPAALYEKLSNSITSNGGTIEGDAAAGSFNIGTPVGKISGHYEVDDNKLNVVIDHKPMLVGCGQIEGVVRKFLA